MHKQDNDVPAPTNVSAWILDSMSNGVSWSGTPPFFAVQRRTQDNGTWSDWEDIDYKDKGTQKYYDPYAPINKNTQYRVGSWNDEFTPPNTSQWSDPSNIVNNPG